MPAKRSTKRTDPGSAEGGRPEAVASPPDSAPGRSDQADAATEPEPGAATEPEPGAATEPETEAAPLNRAERRARGKGGMQPKPAGRGKVAGGHGPAHTQRMWSNRRSGG